MGVLGRVAWAWLVLLLLQLTGASHVVHQNLETEAAAVEAVLPSIVDSQLTTGYHFQPQRTGSRSLSNDERAGFHNSLSASGIRGATRPDCSPPQAFAVAVGKTHHIIGTNLPGLNNSDSLFDRTVQSSTGSLWIALSLTVIVKVALDDQRKKKRGGGDAAAFAKKLLILVLAIAALTNYAMAATGHSRCTHDPNTQDRPCARLSKLVQARNQNLKV